MQDNIVLATNSMRSSVSKLRKRLSDLRIQIETFDSEIDKINAKFENILTQAEVYKAKLEREMGREVRRLNREIDQLKKQGLTTEEPKTSPQELQVASTLLIFESLLKAIAPQEEDFILMSQAFLFPAVYERVVNMEDPAYFLSAVNTDTLRDIIDQGKSLLSSLREEFPSHLIDPETWPLAVEEVAVWWADTGLPQIYGATDPQWETDAPLSHVEIMLWKNSVGDRPSSFPSIYDAFEILRKNQETAYETLNLKETVLA